MTIRKQIVEAPVNQQVNDESFREVDCMTNKNNEACTDEKGKNEKKIRHGIENKERKEKKKDVARSRERSKQLATVNKLGKMKEGNEAENKKTKMKSEEGKVDKKIIRVLSKKKEVQKKSNVIGRDKKSKNRPTNNAIPDFKKEKEIRHKNAPVKDHLGNSVSPRRLTKSEGTAQTRIQTPRIRKQHKMPEKTNQLEGTQIKAETQKKAEAEKKNETKIQQVPECQKQRKSERRQEKAETETKRELEKHRRVKEKEAPKPTKPIRRHTVGNEATMACSSTKSVPRQRARSKSVDHHTTARSPKRLEPRKLERAKEQETPKPAQLVRRHSIGNEATVARSQKISEPRQQARSRSMDHRTPIRSPKKSESRELARQQQLAGHEDVPALPPQESVDDKSRKAGATRVLDRSKTKSTKKKKSAPQPEKTRKQDCFHRSKEQTMEVIGHGVIPKHFVGTVVDDGGDTYDMFLSEHTTVEDFTNNDTSYDSDWDQIYLASRNPVVDRVSYERRPKGKDLVTPCNLYR